MASLDSLLMFADDLYLEGDPYRAALEYKRVLYTLRLDGRDTSALYDTVLVKLASAYVALGDPLGGMRALDYWVSNRSSEGYRIAMGTFYFLMREYRRAERFWMEDDTLRWVARMMLGDRRAFRFLGRPKGLKSPTLAALLSALIPGSGKWYAGRPYDGLYSFALNALMGYGLYDAHRKGDRLRQVVFGVGLAYFYFGNVYGSYVTVRKMNERITLDYVARWLPLF